MTDDDITAPTRKRWLERSSRRETLTRIPLKPGY